MAFWCTDALWDCIKNSAMFYFLYMLVKSHAFLSHTIWMVLLNYVCFIYFFDAWVKSHAIIRNEKIATHPIWMCPKGWGYLLLLGSSFPTHKRWIRQEEHWDIIMMIINFLLCYWFYMLHRLIVFQKLEISWYYQVWLRQYLNALVQILSSPDRCSLAMFPFFNFIMSVH